MQLLLMKDNFFLLFWKINDNFAKIFVHFFYLAKDKERREGENENEREFLPGKNVIMFGTDYG